MAYRHPAAFLLGMEGLALLRAFAGEFDAAFVQDRLTETRDILAAAECGDLGPADEVGETDTVAGYRSWSRTYDEPGNPLIDVEEPIVREIVGALPAGRALDAACGTGRHAAFLASGGHSVVGVDSSPDMLAYARRAAPAAEFVQGDLRDLPVPDASVDLVTCALALTHLPALEPAFAEFARVLRPGGHLVTSDIHWQSLYLGGIASTVDAAGVESRLPASRFRPSAYVTAAVGAGFAVRACHEPLWPHSTTGGGPFLRKWAADAVDAAYENTPAAIVWHFERR
ncbi:Methyltransferase domain-containing protein [Asanoa hainanensis]|uniref:Methyltransferase domain-containing protein n=1 Tax=Asanoa hainanensis TaxID=560556 RepID=A0A239M123_9ACTN|nr:class I SAM-dependent methyltransferase [Asanoa hainanensis]SNT36446.1 Methyltransferase domain-containing protein [Asanoa hainanensis]